MGAPIDMHEGETVRMPILIAELSATDRLGNHENDCLHLCPLHCPHQDPNEHF